MTKRAGVLLLVLAVLALYLGYRYQTREIPCVTPIRYGVVAYDPRFGISQAEFVSDVEEAASVWNAALGRAVFVESKNPVLAVYMQYGDFELAASTASSTAADIDQAKQRMTAAANTYAALQAQVAAAQARGQDATALKKEMNNALASYYALKAQVDADVATASALPQGDIQEGRYVADEQGIRIYIYGFQKKVELKRALIHEFGHALGLNHVPNPDSIMYPSNASGNLALTHEDLAEMVRACADR